MEEIRQTAKLSNQQIQDYKDKLTARIDKTVEDYRVHIASLERPQAEMRREMDHLNMQLKKLSEECDKRRAQQEVTEQRLKIAVQEIKQVKEDKLDTILFNKFEYKTEKNEEAFRARFETLETTVRSALDYVIRHQWKETRNIVNRSLSKVIRPLQLRDLFYVNVNGAEHEIFGNKKASQNNDSSSKGALADLDKSIVENLDLTDESKTLQDTESVADRTVNNEKLNKSLQDVKDADAQKSI